ncbi:hypothetical protein PHMEG_00023772 [Phytophthora megakarya]|uniref:Uncharacterized protein n=1 Tax=Phytophthora megakarya TaxID=4795 RepID=A0A225VIJ4_9STRA|nr:hypothetical protein PHMEG_00023772 [Phytophthora megakarya]
MSLNNLKPANTKRNNESKQPQACKHQACATAVKAFERFLAAESTNRENARAMIAVDPDRANCILVTLMDKFGVYLAFHAGARGQPLSRDSTAQYVSSSGVLTSGRRESGGFAKKAAACTNESLKKMTSYLYSTASCRSYYQDAALVWLFWCLFGCATDLTFARKKQLSIGAVKTSDEPALSLFPDGDPATCPLALTLFTQDSPCTALINHLPVRSKDVPSELTKSILLLDLLDDSNALGSSQTPTTSCHTSATPVAEIHALVNRLLDRVAGPAGVVNALTSNSVRRGDAQHANTSSEWTAQWIFDRGAWNMTTTNKVFAYSKRISPVCEGSE